MDWREQNRVFEYLSALAVGHWNLSGAGDPERISGASVSPSFFRLLGVRPQLGRAFTEDESRSEGKPAVMLSDALWHNRYHADPNVVGQSITLDATAQTVVGVLPAEVPFPFVGPADVWSPRRVGRVPQTSPWPTSAAPARRGPMPRTLVSMAATPTPPRVQQVRVAEAWTPRVSWQA